MNSTIDTCPECEREEAKISPVMVLSVENKGILNASSCILKLYQMERTEKHEARLREMVQVLPEMVSHFRKKEELFLPVYAQLGFDVEKEKEKDKDILEGIDKIVQMEKKSSPYEFEEEFLEFCKKSVLLAKEENTGFLVTCYHNFTLDEMDEIGRRIPDYGYTFLSIKPKPEDLLSREISID